MNDNRPGTSGSYAISAAHEPLHRPSTVPSAPRGPSRLGRKSGQDVGMYSDASRNVPGRVCIAVCGSDMENLSLDLGALSDGWIKSKHANIPRAFESTFAVTPFISHGNKNRRQKRLPTDNLVEVEAPPASIMLRGSLEREYGFQEPKQLRAPLSPRQVSTAPGEVTRGTAQSLTKPLPSLMMQDSAWRPTTAPEMEAVLAKKHHGTAFSGSTSGFMHSFRPVPTSRNGLRPSTSDSSTLTIRPGTSGTFAGDPAILSPPSSPRCNISFTSRAPLASRSPSPPNRASRSFVAGGSSFSTELKTLASNSYGLKRMDAVRTPVYQNVCKTPSNMEAERSNPGAKTGAYLLKESMKRPDGSLGGGSNYKAWVPRQQRHNRIWARKQSISNKAAAERETRGGGFVAPRARKSSAATDAWRNYQQGSSTKR